MRVAFLGTGRMGLPMARHVLEAGHELVTWNRTADRAAPLVAAGATSAATPADASAEAEVIVLALFGPDSVRSVLDGPDGVLAGAVDGALVLDTTTIGPSDARGFEALAKQHGLRYVDAPLFGSIEPAEAGTLATYVGGSVEDVAVARAVLDCWCDPAQVTHVGPVGAGAAVKVVRNMAHGIATAGIGECLRLAADLGVPRDLALEAVSNGPFSWTYGWRGREIAERDHTTVVFSLDLMTKDLALAVQEAARPMPVSVAALEQAQAAQAAGRGSEDYGALADYVEG